MSAADMPMQPIACLEIQIADQAEGFRIGDQVKAGDQVGRLVSFQCRGDDQAGAWVLLDVPGSRHGQKALRFVKLAELVRVKP